MAGWHHQCNEHEAGKTPGDGEGQACCNPWGGRVRHDWVTEQQKAGAKITADFALLKFAI